MIRLSDHFTCRKLFRYALPSIVTMGITSIYGVIDSLFISNFVGKEGVAGVGLIWPPLIILSACLVRFSSMNSNRLRRTTED